MMAQQKDPLGMMAALQAIQNSGDPKSDTSGAATGKQKVSFWLTESLGSHDIAVADLLAEDFTKCTGLEPCWPTHTNRATINEMERRGLGGTLTTEGVTAWGYEVAEALAKKYVQGYHCTKVGRGFIYREALEALRAAGV